MRASPSASSAGGGQPKPRRKKERGRSNQCPGPTAVAWRPARAAWKASGSMPASSRIHGKPTTPPPGSTQSSRGSAASQARVVSSAIAIRARIAGRSSGRRSSARAAIASSTSEPVIWICSFAARKVVSRSASRVASQPVRIPGSP